MLKCAWKVHKSITIYISKKITLNIKVQKNNNRAKITYNLIIDEKKV